MNPDISLIQTPGCGRAIIKLIRIGKETFVLNQSLKEPKEKKKQGNLPK